MKRGLLLDLPVGVGRRLELLYCFVKLRTLALANIRLWSEQSSLLARPRLLLLLCAYWLQTAVFERGRGVSSRAETR